VSEPPIIATCKQRSLAHPPYAAPAAAACQSALAHLQQLRTDPPHPPSSAQVRGLLVEAAERAELALTAAALRAEELLSLAPPEVLLILLLLLLLLLLPLLLLPLLVLLLCRSTVARAADPAASCNRCCLTASRRRSRQASGAALPPRHLAPRRARRSGCSWSGGR